MLREVLPDTRSSRGPSQQIGFPSSAHTPSNTKFPVPNSGYSPHKKAKPVSWGLGPFPAGSGPFVTPLSWQGLCGSSGVWGLAHVTLSIGQKGSSSQDDISSVNISVYVFLKLFCCVLAALPWSPSPPGCSRLLRIPEAGKGNQRDVNNQTSYHPELKADVGICTCPGPFLHHNPIPSPGVSEQSAVDYKHRKDEAGNPGLPVECQNYPTDTGGTTRNPSLPPSCITASSGLVWEEAEAPRVPQHSSPRALAAADVSGLIAVHIHHSRQCCPSEGNLSRARRAHTQQPPRPPLPLAASPQAGQDPAQPLPRSRDLAAFALSPSSPPATQRERPNSEPPVPVLAVTTWRGHGQTLPWKHLRRFHNYSHKEFNAQ